MVKIQVHATEHLSVDATGIVEKKYNYGSGFYISENGLILSAAHVIEKASKLNRNPITCFDLNNGKSVGLRIVFVDKEADVVLLQNVTYTRQKKKRFFIKIYSKASKLMRGMDAFCIGFPNEIQKYGRLYAISSGKVLELSADLPGHKKLKWRKNVLIADCEVASGFSGGLIIDSSFLPIGMIIGSYEKKGQRKSLIRRIRHIRKALQKHHVELR